jgi:SO2946-like, C-terminal domain
MSLNLFLNKRFSMVLEPAVLDEAHGGTHQSSYTKGDLLYASATNTLSKLGVGTIGQIIKSDGLIPGWGFPYVDPTLFYWFKEDFSSTNSVGTNEWVHTSSGGTVEVYGSVSAGVAPVYDTNVIGVLGLSTGGGSTNTASTMCHDEAFCLGGGTVLWFSRIQLSALSDGTDTYQVQIGFGDHSASAYDDGIWFDYIHSANSGKWVCKTASNTTVTTLNTSTTAVAGQWVSLAWVLNANATSVEFFINGVSQGTITTNIPSGVDRATGPRMRILKSAGTNSRSLYCDYVEIFERFTTPR